jgi:ribosomal protein S18 acetylase RimI-like enzyme
MEIVIRKYSKEDKADIRKICIETAFLEESNKIFFDDDELLADALTLYFTDYEPESCFVATQGNQVVGYIIGTINVKNAKKTFKLKILPILIYKFFLKGLFFKKISRTFLFNLSFSLLKGEFFIPDFTKQYPATLHINIDKNYRRDKLGSKLIETYLNYLKEKNIRGVYLSTLSEAATQFFIKMGFKPLLARQRNYLKYYFKKDMLYYVLGKTL